MNATRAKLVADVAVSKPCHSTSGPIVAKNVDSSWIEMRIVLTTSLRGSLPGSGHTRAIPCGVRMFSPQRICLTTFKKAGYFMLSDRLCKTLIELVGIPSTSGHEELI